MIILPDFIKKCIKTLEQNGYSAYLVGGAVRDFLMNKKPNDFDIATGAPAEKVVEIFEKTVPTGIKHGTVTVFIDKKQIEVTTFRTDGDYLDFRHPNAVQFVGNIKEDLSRRDFTINALAYNENDGLIDLFGGLNDINAKIIKAVDEPDKRFEEDALRILRCFRFAAQLDFAIENNTLFSAIKMSDNLKNISSERIFDELKRIFVSENPEIINYLLNKEFFKNLFTKHTLFPAVISKTPNEFCLRFAAFCAHNNVLPSPILKTLKSDRKTQIKADYYFSALKMIASANYTEYKKQIKDIKPCDLIMISKLKMELFNKDNTDETEMAEKIIKNNEPYRLDMLLITGGDIYNLGYRGQEIAEKYEFLLDCCIKNPDFNKRESLIKLIKN